MQEKMTDSQIDAYCDGLAKSGTEHGHQRAFFAWLAFKQDEYPDGKLAFAIPNGGLRDQITAGKLKAEGVKAGVPDIFYPVPMNSPDLETLAHGLFIEMKSGEKKGAVKLGQETWHRDLRMRGYAVAVCWNWRAARNCFVHYHKEETQHEYA